MKSEVTKTGHAVVVFSGGQDSTTCLYWALSKFETVSAISFAYGQNHEVELKQARIIAEREGVSLDVFELPMFTQLANSALVTGGDVTEAHPNNAKLPASYVPNRNAIFLTIAHAYAQKLGADSVITGVCETDFSGYPDCRSDFISALNLALNNGADCHIKILTPLMWLNKAQTFELAENLGCLQIILDDSHTCYNGKRSPKFKWGRGCGVCPACNLRSNGFQEYLLSNK